jgi:hypothetical protein
MAYTSHLAGIIAKVMAITDKLLEFFATSGTGATLNGANALCGAVPVLTSATTNCGDQFATTLAQLAVSSIYLLNQVLAGAFAY